MSNIDHHLISYVDERLKESKIEEIFTHEQLQSVANNLIEGQIKRAIIERFGPIVKEKIESIIEDEIVKAFEHNSFQIVISHIMKTFIFSDDFKDKITGMLEQMIDRAIDCD